MGDACDGSWPLSDRGPDQPIRIEGALLYGVLRDFRFAGMG